MDAKQATGLVTVNIQSAYTWRAHYGDTDFLDEAHAVGGFASVDQARCTSLELICVETAVNHIVDIPTDSMPVFFRRRSVRGLFQPIHCIGWRRSEDDAVYLFMYEDGSTLLSSDLQAV